MEVHDNQCHVIRARAVLDDQGGDLGWTDTLLAEAVGTLCHILDSQCLVEPVSRQDQKVIELFYLVSVCLRLIQHEVFQVPVAKRPTYVKLPVKFVPKDISTSLDNPEILIWPAHCLLN